MKTPSQAVLIAGSRRAGSLELAYERAFQRLGVPVEHLDLEAPAALLARNRVIRRLTPRLQYQRVGRHFFDFLTARAADYAAVIVFKGMWLTPAWLGRCKNAAPGATWINLNPDDPFNLSSPGSTNQNVVQSIGQYDLYATWGAHLMPALEAAGCAGTLFVPFAYDADCHFPAENLAPELAEQISFIGAWDLERERILTQVADFPLRIHGYGWDRLRPGSPLHGKASSANVYGPELRRIISSSRAALNLLRPQNFGSHNMRTFEIPAMRGLMVTTHSPEQNRFFSQDKACLMFDDAPGLRRQLERVMGDSLDAAGIKGAAWDCCRGQSYDDRARALHEAIVSERRARQTL